MVSLIRRKEKLMPHHKANVHGVFAVMIRKISIAVQSDPMKTWDMVESYTLPHLSESSTPLYPGHGSPISIKIAVF